MMSIVVGLIEIAGVVYYAFQPNKTIDSDGCLCRIVDKNYTFARMPWSDPLEGYILVKEPTYVYPRQDFFPPGSMKGIFIS